MPPAHAAGGRFWHFLIPFGFLIKLNTAAVILLFFWLITPNRSALRFRPKCISYSISLRGGGSSTLKKNKTGEYWNPSPSVGTGTNS